ncbi:MAG: hypothetical protein ACPG47_05035 [Leucothrix sp.]
MMKLLPHSLMGCCLLCISQMTVANCMSIDNLSAENTAPSPSNGLGSEEMRYIRLECEGFAKVDGISSDQHANYIETCIKELSVVVQDAINSRIEDSAGTTDSINEGLLEEREDL